MLTWDLFGDKLKENSPSICELCNYTTLAFSIAIPVDPPIILGNISQKQGQNLGAIVSQP